MSVIHKEESYQIVGACYEVFNNLGSGFKEVVYQDALELEFNIQGIPFKREVHYEINYKGTNLPHSFYADFVVFDKIILELKGVSEFNNAMTAQCINYLAVSGLRLALLVNFSIDGVEYKRIVK